MSVTDPPLAGRQGTAFSPAPEPSWLGRTLPSSPPPSPREHRRGGYGSRSGQPPRTPSKIIRAQQRGIDVITERRGHAGGGGGDPAEPGDRGDGEQHAGDLVVGRARRQRGSGAPFQAGPR